jgi:hypothetical protein
VVRHRIQLSKDAVEAQLGKDDVIEEILKEVPVPKGGEMA